MTLTFTEIAEKYLDERVVSRIYAHNVRRIAARVSTVSTESLNRFLRRRSEERAGTTVRAERGVLLTLWKWAYDGGHVDTAPRGVIRIKARRAPTKAWTIEQLKSALAATHKHDSVTLKSGASKGLLLRCWMLLGYEAGARWGDLFTLRGDHLEGDAIAWTQSKTGDPIVRALSPACLTACREMLAKSPDGRILGWAVGRRQSQLIMREHLDACGIGGSSKWLRRSGATHIEMTEPGKATHHLGHRTANLAAQNYIDWSQVRRNAPKTPELV